MPNEQKIEIVTLQLLSERGMNKTICPSEVARIMAKLDGQPDQWRDWTKQARAVAIQMAKRGQIEVVQHGKEVDLTSVKGPIRLRTPRLPF